MKINSKKLEKNSEPIEFKFDNGAWVSIHINNEDGDNLWEYQSNNDDDDTYLYGTLMIENGEVIDYDGCYELPQEVKLALTDLNIGINQL